MKKAILHIGFPKTGTTSVQAFLHDSRDTLAQVGVHYPVFDHTELGLPRLVHHLPLLVALMQNLPSHLSAADHRACRSAFDDTFGSFRKSMHETIIVSHETLSQNTPGLDYARLATATYGLDTHVIAYVRVYDEWIESLYAQNIGDERVLKKPISEMHIVRRMEANSFLTRLRRIRAALPHATFSVRSFDACRNVSLVRDFLVTANIPLTVEIEAKVAAARAFNSRPLAADSMFLAHLSLGMGNTRLVRQAARALREHVKSGAPHPLGGKRYGFLPPESKQQARDIYVRELPRLREEFGLNAPEPKALTDTDFDYATEMVADEYQAVADIIAPYFSPEDAATVRAAYRRLSSVHR